MSSPELWIYDRDGRSRDTPPAEHAVALAALVRQFAATGAPIRAHVPPANGVAALDVTLRRVSDEDVAVAVVDSTMERDLQRQLSRYELVLRATRHLTDNRQPTTNNRRPTTEDLPKWRIALTWLSSAPDPAATWQPSGRHSSG